MYEFMFRGLILKPIECSALPGVFIIQSFGQGARTMHTLCEYLLFSKSVHNVSIMQCTMASVIAPYMWSGGLIIRVDTHILFLYVEELSREVFE